MSELFLDHVALAVRDLDAAERCLRESFGLGVVDGGDHPHWGTGNRIVPLAKHFIEVVGVTDVEVASSNPVGRYILSQTQDGDRFVGVCLGSTDPRGTTERLGLVWSEGERDTPNGRLTFRSAGIERSIREGGGFPYFFEYDDRAARLGHGDPRHAIEPRGIARIELIHDRTRFRDYLRQPAQPPQRVGSGSGARAAGPADMHAW